MVIENQFKFNSKIVGSTFRDGATELIKGLVPDQVLYLKHEADNAYDPNAIAIHLSSEMNSKTHLGYIPKETAAKLVKDVQANNVICQVAQVTGGVSGKENVGCNTLLVVNRLEEGTTNAN